MKDSRVPFREFLVLHDTGHGWQSQIIFPISKIDRTAHGVPFLLRLIDELVKRASKKGGFD